MSIIGNGDIAKILIDREDFIFFASGVSNSGNDVPESEYQREIDLLMKQDRNEHLVYFGSLAIFNTSFTRYAKHKKQMEDLVKKEFKHYTIVRIGNITWGSNPNTLINFMKNKVKNGEPLEIQDVYRFIISKEDFLYWIDLIPEWSCEMNLSGTRMKVKEIVEKYVRNT